MFAEIYWKSKIKFAAHLMCILCLISKSRWKLRTLRMFTKASKEVQWCCLQSQKHEEEYLCSYLLRWQGVQTSTLPLFTSRRDSGDVQTCIIGLISRLAKACNQQFLPQFAYNGIDVQPHTFVHIWLGLQRCAKKAYLWVFAHLVSKQRRVNKYKFDQNIWQMFFSKMFSF